MTYRKGEKHCELTKEKLREFKGYENISDQDAVNTIKILEKLSIILYEFYQDLKEKENE